MKGRKGSESEGKGNRRGQEGAGREKMGREGILWVNECRANCVAGLTGQGGLGHSGYAIILVRNTSAAETTPRP